MPRGIVDLRVERRDDDYWVWFKFDSGEELEATGRGVYDPPLPFEDLADVFGFLNLQSVPAELIYRELGALGPHGEDVVAARRRANDEATHLGRDDRT